MDTQTVINKELPKLTGEIKEIMSKAKRKEFSQKEAFKILIANPIFLDPLLFLLFINDADLIEVISYHEYAAIMRKKAIKIKNQSLLNLANESLIRSNELKW